MTERGLSDNAPGTALFPQFESDLYRMVAAEVSGLTDQQLDWESDSWEWSKWSIRRQVSHMPSFVSHWLLLSWGEQLFPQGTSELGELAEYSRSSIGSWLDEEKYKAFPTLLQKVDQSMQLAWYVLTRETVASLRQKEIPRRVVGSMLELALAHETGVRWDDNDADSYHITLEATFRHLNWETTTHLYNVQRLKRAQGLGATVDIPFEGYWALPDWDRSEP